MKASIYIWQCPNCGLMPADPLRTDFWGKKCVCMKSDFERKRKRLVVYRYQLQAMAALANRKEKNKWHITRTENGWWVIVPN